MQSFFYAIRRGQTSQALTILVVTLAGAGVYFREWKEPWATYLVDAALGLAGMCSIWLAWRVWKIAAPPPEPSGKAPPSAIKGLLPWGIADGELFASLGRRGELQFLLDRAQSDQVPITVVRGESGSGKTSLLRAGLQYTLKKDTCVYWEARSNDAPQELLHAIQNQFPDVESLASLPAKIGNRWVLILDQFEQLRAARHDHQPVFQLLERIAKEPAPHRLSVVIGFRREYQADWSDFELAHQFRAEQVAVNLMSRAVAADVIATLSGKVGFALEQELVNNFLASLAQDPSKSDRVSPLDISIGLEGLANFAQQRSIDRVTMNDYQLAGGAEGLLLVFAQQRLEEVPEDVRAPLLNGIVLSLIDLATNQRVAEGASAAAIASNTPLPPAALRPWLDRLTHPRVRLLEGIAPDRYRLPHERLIPVLRRLTGIALASLDGTRMLLESECARWQLTHSRRNLISGKDLSEVMSHRDQLIPGGNAEGKALYLEACLGRRRLLRLTGISVATAVVGAAYGTYRGFDALQQERALTSWGLSPELFRRQHDVDALRISTQINDFGWLRSARIRQLEVQRFSGSSLAELRHLRGLTTLELNLRNSHMSSFAGLEQLTDLTALTVDLSDNLINTSMAGLEQLTGLATLTVKLNFSNIISLTGLQRLKGVTAITLDFQLRQGVNVPISSLELLEPLAQLKRLTSLTLDLTNSKITNLAGLERLKGLATLDLNLVGSDITSLSGLEVFKDLTVLTLNLGDSKITSLAGLDHLKGLTELALGLGGTKIARLVELAQLPDLTSLSLGLRMSEITSLAGLEQLEGLTTLRLYVSPTLKTTTLAGLGRLKRLTKLDLTDTKIASWAAITPMQGLTTLTLSLANSEITSLAGLEQLKGLTTLTLNLGNSEITSLGGLEQLKSLTTLTLSLGNSKIASLAGLGQLKGLTTLTLNLGDSIAAAILGLERMGGPTSLAGLEPLKGLNSLTLDLRHSKITTLAGVEHLKGLTTITLDLRDSKIIRLHELEQLKGLNSAKLWLPLALVARLKIRAKQVVVDCSV